MGFPKATGGEPVVCIHPQELDLHVFLHTIPICFEICPLHMTMTRRKSYAVPGNAEYRDVSST